MPAGRLVDWSIGRLVDWWVGRLRRGMQQELAAAPVGSTDVMRIRENGPWADLGTLLVSGCGAVLTASRRDCTHRRGTLRDAPLALAHQAAGIPPPEWTPRLSRPAI